MIFKRQSWFNRSLALFLTFAVFISVYSTNVYAADETQTVYEQLEALLEEIDGLSRDDYIEEAYDNLKEQADSVIRPVDPDEMPEYIAQIMLNLLTDMKASLVRKDSVFGKIELLLDEFYALDAGDYVASGYNAMKNMADSIIRPIDPSDPDGMTEEIAELVYGMLKEQMDALVAVDSSWGKLETLLDEIYALNSEDYSEESYNALIEQADSVIRPVDPNEMPEFVAVIMTDTLQSLMDSLEEGKSIYEKLEDKLAQAEALNVSDYTQESWQAVQDIIDALERPVSSDNITEKLATKMLSDLETAILALEAAPDEGIVLEDGTYSAKLTKKRGYDSWYDDNVKIVVKDGKYSVTFYTTSSTVWTYHGDYKSNEQYIFYGKNDFRYVLMEVMKPTEDSDNIKNYYASKNLIDGYDISNSGFSDEIKEKVSADYDDMFYDTQYQVLDDGIIAFTVELENLDDSLLLNYIYELDIHSYGTDEIRQTNYIYGETSNAVTLDADSIEKIPESFDGIEGTTSFNYDSSDTLPYLMRSNEAEWTSENGKLYVTYSVNTDGWAKYIKNGQSVEIMNTDYEPIEVVDGKITLEYDSIDDVVYGVEVIVKTLYVDSYRGITYNYSFFRLSPYFEVKPVTLVDSATGIKLLTSSKYVSENAQLKVNVIEDTGSTDEKNNAFANLKSHVTSYNKITFFNITVSDNGETVTDFGTRPVLEIPLEEGMNQNTLRTFINIYFNESGQKGFMYGWFNSNGIVDGDMFSLLLEKDYVTANWAVYDEKLSETDGSDLEDGTYIVPITTFNESAPDQTSMSAQCIGSEAVLVVKDGVKRLELNFSPVAIGDANGYLIQMWKQNTDGEYEELTYTSYYKNEDGSYYTDEVNEGTTDYYPMTGYMILPSDDPQFITKFRVSAMDALIDGIATRDAIFTIYYDDAVKISDETPDAAPEEVIDSEKADKSILEKLISDAASYEEDDYTTSTYTVFVNALEAAKLVAANSKATQDTVDEAVNSLQNAIDGLTKKPVEEININNLPDGKYTLYAQMIKTDHKSFSMSDGAINHNVWLEVEDGEYYLTIQFKGLAIYNKFGYLMNLSYFDEGYTYNEYGIPEGNLVPAEVLSTYDVIDQYNDADNMYPELLRIKLVDKAAEKYVPLQVFVPIMEDIAEETGTQAVLMQLDWTALKVDNGEIQPEAPVEQSPAVDFTDAATGVKVSADKGVFEEGVQIVVTEITSGTDYKNASAALSDEAEEFKLYDVRFYDAYGNAISPNGTVTISFPVPDGAESGALAVYRINGDGSKTLVKGAVDGEYYTIVTKTAAVYSLVIADSQNVKDNSDNDVDDDNYSDNSEDDSNVDGADSLTDGDSQSSAASDTAAPSPRTDDTAAVTLLFVLMLISAGSFLTLLKTKRN